MALCVFCNVAGLEDIVFEKYLPDAVTLEDDKDNVYTANILSEAEQGRFPCSWTQERYEKVINSPRCKLRKEIIKHIAPGDRTKKVSGWWWNW